MIEIDGSHGEGGGQILRMALVMSLITQKPFRMTGIRAGRKQPGLKAQHLHVLRALGPLTGSLYDQAEIGQTKIRFEPGELSGGKVEADIGTAGSITLWLQTLLPVCVFSKEHSLVTVTGGTDVSFAPPLDYFEHVVTQYAEPYCDALDVFDLKRGFYPKGGGKVQLAVLAASESRVKPLALASESEIELLRIYSRASEDLRKSDVVDRQLKAAVEALKPLGGLVTHHAEYCDAISTGSVVTIVAEKKNGHRMGADALGARGKPAEQVGAEAASGLLEEIGTGASVDRHAGDQMVFWLWKAGGEARVSQITDHTRTAIWLIEQFVGPWCAVDGNTIRKTG